MHLDGPEMNAAGGSQDVNKSGGRKWDIEPVLDRLVLFRSDFVDHEVSQTVRSRKGARFPAAQGCSRAGGFFFSIRAALFRFAACCIFCACFSRVRSHDSDKVWAGKTVPKRTAASV